MKQYKGYLFRLYPTDMQKELINKSLGVSRFIYNYFLDFKRKEYEENNKKYSCYDLIKMIPALNIEYSFLKEVDSCLLRCSIFDLDNAFNNFYKGKGYPNFKKKGVKDSYKTIYPKYHKHRMVINTLVHDQSKNLQKCSNLKFLKKLLFCFSK